MLKVENEQQLSEEKGNMALDEQSDLCEDLKTSGSHE